MELTGNCLCGAVKYKYNGELGPSNYCHCRDCRKVTGSAFNIGIRLQLDDLKVVGEVVSFSKLSDSGNRIAREFCKICGSPLFTKSKDKPEFVWVKAGSLEDPNIINPSYQIWTNSRVSWSVIDESMESFEREH